MKKLALLPLLFLICSCNGNKSNTPEPSKDDESGQKEEVDLTPSITNENMIHYFGRHSIKNDNVYFAFSGSGFEIKINVKETTNRVLGSFHSYAEQGGPAQFAYVYVDGVEPEEKLALPNTTSTYELTSNLNVGEHYLRFVKLNEGAFTNITLKDLSFEGCEWLRYDKKYEKRIGFYGDSITCGYGTDGTTNDPFSLVGENFAHTYAYECARVLDYDYTAVSESGISICMNAWGSETYFKDIFKTINCVDEYDYKLDPVDIAVIALGTNDNTKFTTYSAAEQKEKIELIYQGYIQIAEMIREANPNTQFFFVYNLMISQNGLITTAIKGTTIYLNNNYGDGTAYMLEFTPDHAGSGSHPGGKASIADGKILAEFIQNPYEEE